MEKRLKALLSTIQGNMRQYGTAVVNRWDIDRAEASATWRFMNNPSVTVEELESILRKECLEQSKGENHVLLIEDTTEISYESHRGRFSNDDISIGVLSDNRTKGILAHCCLCISATTLLPIGISAAKIWARPKSETKKSSRAHKQKQRLKPEQERESRRWIEQAQRSMSALSPTTKVTVVADRESDMYALLEELPNERIDVLVRSSYDRMLVGEEKLSEVLSRQPILGVKTMEIKNKNGAGKRSAVLEFRSAQVTIKAPQSAKNSKTDSLKVWAVEVREQATTESTETPICWRLLTTHNAETFQQSEQIAEWYSRRWMIEDLHRILKTEGLDIESSQFEQGAALHKLLLIALREALTILLLRQERHGIAGLKASCRFSDDEIEALEALGSNLEGKTKKQQNPFDKFSLAWAGWIIARLGGWLPYDMNVRPPGVITYVRGMIRFRDRYEGWLTLKNRAENNRSHPP